MAIVKGGRYAYGCDTSMLLRRGLADSIRIDSDVSKKRIRGVGEILNLPKGKEFFYLLLYKRYINIVYYYVG